MKFLPSSLRPALLAGGSLFAAAAFCPTLAQAASYRVQIDTRSIAGTAGSVDFQWDLGAGSPSLPASVGSFASSGGTLVGDAVLLSGSASGTLAPGGRLDFSGADALSYVYQNLVFGRSVGFALELPDAFAAQADPGFGSVFSVALFDASLNPALPTSSPDALALRFDFQPGGGAPTITSLTTPGSISVLAAVPEPPEWTLLAAGLAGIGAWRGRRTAVAGSTKQKS